MKCKINQIKKSYYSSGGWSACSGGLVMGFLTPVSDCALRLSVTSDI